ncbi:MAG: hypothetical protein V7640_4147 [Betaproteobacteria bacterium]|jgi:hypothetical protein
MRLVAIAAALLLVMAGCGRAKEEPKTTTCYDTSRQCMKVCDETEQNAAAASVGCRDTCNGSYKAAVGVCAEMSDRDKRQACIDNANQDFGDCLGGCQVTLDKARKDALDCRNTCVDQLQQCTSGK